MDLQTTTPTRTYRGVDLAVVGGLLLVSLFVAAEGANALFAFTYPAGSTYTQEQTPMYPAIAMALLGAALASTAIAVFFRHRSAAVRIAAILIGLAFTAWTAIRTHLDLEWIMWDHGIKHLVDLFHLDWDMYQIHFGSIYAGIMPSVAILSAGPLVIMAAILRARTLINFDEPLHTIDPDPANIAYRSAPARPHIVIPRSILTLVALHAIWRLSFAVLWVWSMQDTMPMPYRARFPFPVLNDTFVTGAAGSATLLIAAVVGWRVAWLAIPLLTAGCLLDIALEARKFCIDHYFRYGIYDPWSGADLSDLGAPSISLLAAFLPIALLLCLTLTALRTRRMRVSL